MPFWLSKMVLALHFGTVSFWGWYKAQQSLTAPGREECNKFDLTCCSLALIDSQS